MSLRQKCDLTVEPSQTFGEWLEQMHLERYTGAVLVHFGDGTPRKVQPLKSDVQIALDIPSRRRQD